MCSNEVSTHIFLGEFSNLRKATISFMSVSPSVRMEQLGCHQTYFHKILYLRTLRKSVKKFKFCYILTTIIGTIHEDRYTFLFISPSVFLRMKIISDRSCRENQITHFVFSNVFSEKRVVYEIMWKKLLLSGAGHRWQYGACALHAGQLRLQTLTVRLCSNFCFSTATMVARTRLNVTLYVYCLSVCVFLSLTSSRRMNWTCRRNG